MKNSDVFLLAQEYNKLKTCKGVKLGFIINKNIQEIEKIIAPIKEAYSTELSSIADIDKYKDDLRVICMKFGLKDGNGELLVNGNGDISMPNTPESKSALKANNEKYSAVITESESIEKEYTELLDQDVFVDLKPIEMSLLENAEISATDIIQLSKFDLIVE